MAFFNNFDLHTSLGEVMFIFLLFYFIFFQFFLIVCKFLLFDIFLWLYFKLRIDIDYGIFGFHTFPLVGGLMGKLFSSYNVYIFAFLLFYFIFFHFYFIVCEFFYYLILLFMIIFHYCISKNKVHYNLCWDFLILRTFFLFI